MNEQIAWNNFINTGSIESFLLYKKLLEKPNENNGYLEENSQENVGELYREVDKSEGDCDTRNPI